MQEGMYDFFNKIMRDSKAAYQYAEEHFDELMARPIAKVLYGPPAYGPGAAIPSRHFVSDAARNLKTSTRRKQYKLYAIGSKGDILYSKSIRKNGTVDCTYIHFWMGNTNYARGFLGDENKFYTNIVFSSQYVADRAICFAMADPERIYVEYFSDRLDANGVPKTLCRWYDYYPNRIVSEEGMILSKDEPFGSPKSPVKMGSTMFEPLRRYGQEGGVNIK